jgi:hypothetical protein
MKNQNMKIPDANIKSTGKLPKRKAYSPPRLVCYGDLNELTQIFGGNIPPNTDIYFGSPFGTAYKI